MGPSVFAMWFILLLTTAFQCFEHAVLNDVPSSVHDVRPIVHRRRGKVTVDVVAAQLLRAPCNGTTYPFLVSSYGAALPPNCLASYPSVVVFSVQTDYSLTQGNPASTGWSYLWSPQGGSTDVHAFPYTTGNRWSMSATYRLPLVSSSCGPGFVLLHVGCQALESVHVRLTLPPFTPGGLYFQYAISGNCDKGNSAVTLTSNAATSTPIISFASSNAQTGVSQTPFTNFEVPAGTYVDTRVSVANGNCDSAGTGVAVMALFFPQGQPNPACAFGSPTCEVEGEVAVYDAVRDFTVAVPRSDWRLPWRYGWSSELGFTSLPRTFVTSTSNPPESNSDYSWGFGHATQNRPYIVLAASTIYNVTPGSHLVLHPGCAPDDSLRAEVRWQCPTTDPGAVHIAGDWINGEVCGDARTVIRVGTTAYFGASSTSLSTSAFTFAARIGGAVAGVGGDHVAFIVAASQVCTCTATGLAARIRWFSLPPRNASCGFQARRCDWEKQSIAIYRMEDDLLSQSNPTDGNWTFGDSTLPTPTGALDTSVAPMTDVPWQSGESVGYRSLVTGTSVSRFIGVPEPLVGGRQDNRVVTLTSCFNGAAAVPEFHRAVARWFAPQGGIRVRVTGGYFSPMAPVVRGAIAVPCANYLWVAPTANSSFDFTVWLCDRPSAHARALIDFTMFVDVAAATAAGLPCPAINVSVTGVSVTRLPSPL